MLRNSFIVLTALLAMATALGSCVEGQISNTGRAASGDPSANPAADGIGDPGAPSFCPSGVATVSASNGWQSKQASQSAVGGLYFEFMARPTKANLDGLVAVGAQNIDEFADGAIAIRFSDSGLVDVRDGTEYSSDGFFEYESGVWYNVAVSANVAARTYDVEMGRCGEARETVIQDAAFRADANFDDRLSTWAVWSSQSAALEVSTPTWMADGSCVPATCESVGTECGQPSDGCNGTLSCGGCSSGQTCSSGVCMDAPVSAPPPLPPPPPGPGDPSDRPLAHNTGPSNPAALVPSGSLEITTDGAVVENVDVTGRILIDADNVTLRNFRVNSTSFYGVQIENGHSGILIEDGEIYNCGSACVFGVGHTSRRLHLHDGNADGMKIHGSGGPTLVEYCFIEKLSKAEGAHADGNQSKGGSNITFRYNNFDLPIDQNPYGSNATMMLELDINNFVLEHNWLNGGNYTVYCKDSLPSGIYVRNNIFGRDYRYGVRGGSCAEWTGNVWEDTGGPVP